MATTAHLHVANVGGNPDSSATLISFNVLETVLEVGDYRKEFKTARRGIGGVWKECAEQIVKQLRAWTDANRDKVLSRRANAKD